MECIAMIASRNHVLNDGLQIFAAPTASKIATDEEPALDAWLRIFCCATGARFGTAETTNRNL